MELNITEFFYKQNPHDFYGSVATHGEGVGEYTFNAAKECAVLVLDTPEKIEAFRKYAKTFGAWSEEEIADWNETECNALMLQLISADMVENGLSKDSTLEEVEESACNIFFDVEGNAYYYMGS